MNQPRRRIRIGNAFIAALTITAGLITILGLFAEPDTVFGTLGDTLLQLAAVTTAIAVIIGILNLLIVHLSRIIRGSGGWPYSLVTLLAALGVAAVYALDYFEVWSGDLEDEQLSPLLFDTIEVTIESALAGLIAFFLVYAAYRLLNQRFGWSSLLFLAAVVLILLGWLPLTETNLLGDMRDWLMDYPVLAGARGLLIGIGLGTVIVGIRLLTGYDRAYREP